MFSRTQYSHPSVITINPENRDIDHIYFKWFYDFIDTFEICLSRVKDKKVEKLRPVNLIDT